MSFTSVALQMLTVSLPILLGWCIAKLGFMKAEFERELSHLLLQVALPCLVLSSALGDDVKLPSIADTFSLMGLSFVMYVVAIVIAFAVTAALRVPKGTECSYRFAVLFGNAGFIGFPVISAVLGKQALLYASIALIPPNFLMFTIGVMLFSGMDGGLKKQMRNIAACCKSPGLIASAVVLGIVLTGWTDWGVLGDSISIVGTMTTPAALLLMGSSIAKYRPLEMLTNWRAYVAVAYEHDSVHPRTSSRISGFPQVINAVRMSSPSRGIPNRLVYERIFSAAKVVNSVVNLADLQLRTL